MAKHDRAFVEITSRVFVPLDSEILKDFTLDDLLSQLDSATIYRHKKQWKGGKENAEQ